MKSLEDLVDTIKFKRDETLIVEVVEAMTTNESLFFRDTKPFDQLRDLVFPRLLEKRTSRKRIRIWSAAYSSGQEPYSIAMLVKEIGAPHSNWTIEIMATDLSEEILNRARDGIYSQFEVQRSLPIIFLLKYLKQDGDRWEIDPAIRSMVTYKQFNLLDDPSVFGLFDIVMGRNVLIYFDQTTKGEVLVRISNVTSTDGTLYLGGAETVLGITEEFEPVAGQRGLYKKPSAEPARMSA